MIVRIMGEGQFDLDDSEVHALNELDSDVESAVESGDEQRFRSSLDALLEAVRQRGEPVADDTLVDSDLILPPADATLQEVQALLGDEGLIPDPV
jgi:hypothetical protein